MQTNSCDEAPLAQVVTLCPVSAGDVAKSAVARVISGASPCLSICLHTFSAEYLPSGLSFRQCTTISHIVSGISPWRGRLFTGRSDNVLSRAVLKLFSSSGLRPVYNCGQRLASLDITSKATLTRIARQPNAYMSLSEVALPSCKSSGAEYCLRPPPRCECCLPGGAVPRTVRPKSASRT